MPGAAGLRLLRRSGDLCAVLSHPLSSYFRKSRKTRGTWRCEAPGNAWGAGRPWQRRSVRILAAGLWAARKHTSPRSVISNGCSAGRCDQGLSQRWSFSLNVVNEVPDAVTAPQRSCGGLGSGWCGRAVPPLACCFPSCGARGLTSRWSPPGGPGAVDGERRPHPGQQRPRLHAAEDPQRPDPDLLHPADVPVHLGEQAHGGHHPGRLAARVP